MKSVLRARVLVLVGEASDHSFIHALARMGLAVRIVAALAEARQMCQADAVDACLVVLAPVVADEAPRVTVEAEAPGRAVGVPSLLLADVITPYLAKTARRSGYVAAVALGMPRRLLYRRLRALLQRARAPIVRAGATPSMSQSRRPRPLGIAGGGKAFTPGKPKLQ